MKTNGARFICALLLILGWYSAFADDREEKIDVFIVVDKSLSMVEEIDSVREYIRTSIVGNLLNPEDQLVLIAFYGNAEAVFMGAVDEDMSFARAAVDEIEADGRFTDIGNALDTLWDTIPLVEIEGRRKYLLLITDGIQEPPPESKYYSTEVAFNHEFLKDAKEIRKEGWKIHILGIGAGSAAQELAEELSGTFVEVGEEPTVEELEASTPELLGIVELVGTPRIAKVKGDGSSEISLTVASKGYSSVQRIAIERLTLEIDGASVASELTEALRVEIEPESTALIEVPLLIESDLAAGSHQGVLTFSFDGQAAFTPSSVAVEFTVRTFIGNNIWILPAGALVVVALFAAAMMLARRGGSLAFLCEIADGPARKRAYKLKFKERLFLIDGVMGFNILPSAGQTPAAELSADATGLHLTITDEKQIRVGEIPANLIGKTIEVRKQNGKKASLSFDAA